MALPNPGTEIARKAIDAAKRETAAGGAIVDRLAEDMRRPRQDRSLPVRKPPTPTETEDGPALLEMVANIITAERAGRPITAALGLTRLRELYEGLDPTTGAGWADFVRAYLEPAIGLTRINELIGRMVHRGAMLRCSECEAEVRCPCGCGAPYVGTHRWAKPAPVKERSALDRAAAAVAAHPEMSDRAIAERFGVHRQTVKRARRQVADSVASVPVDVPLDARVGRDGRRRKVLRS